MEVNLQMIYLQEQHIKKLQEKVDIQKQKIVNKVFNTENWILFLMKRSPSYFRPKRSLSEAARQAEMYGKMSLEFDDKGNISLKVSYTGKNGYNFRTVMFPISELEEFIKDSPDDDKIYKWTSARYY